MKIVRLFLKAKWFAILSVSALTTLNTTINAQSLRENRQPKITMENTGKFVIVWENESEDSGYYNIKARGYYANGTERFEEITVNTDLEGQHRKPDVAMYYGEDNFVVVWEDDSDDNGYYDIMIRGFSSDGTERFAERRVNTSVYGQKRNPAIAISIYGSFVVVWEDDRDSVGIYQIYLRGFYPDGTESFYEKVVNTYTSGQHKRPAIARGTDDGRFIVAWEDDSDDDEYYNIHAKGFWGFGASYLPEWLVNTITTGQQISPANSYDLFPGYSYNFIVVWADDNDNNNIFQIYARGFSPNGSSLFQDLFVSSTTSSQTFHPDVAKGPGSFPIGGDFVVVWQVENVDGTSSIYARGFLMDGTEQFPTMVVNSDKEGRHSYPAIAKDVAGNFVVVWQSDNGNGYSNIYARGFYRDGTPRFPEIIVTSISNDQLLSPVTDCALFQNYPNPFNPITKIKYQIPELSFVTIKVYDVLGNEISIPVNEEKPAGTYEVEFDGAELPSGIYFYQLKAESYVETKKMVLIK